MKLKEAIKILQDFQQVAGEDAQCDLGQIRLESRVHVEYDNYGSYRGEVEKSRALSYTIVGYRETPQIAQCEAGAKHIDWNESLLNR